MIRMRIREVSSCAEHEQTVVVLEDTSGQRRLAVGVDPDESRRLIRELGDDPRDRDPVYDFVERALRACAVTPTRVMLEYEPGVGLRSVISFEGPGGEASMPCRVSDALALVRRNDLSLYVSANVFADTEPVKASASASSELRDVAQWLDQIRPGDFSLDGPDPRPKAD